MALSVVPPTKLTDSQGSGDQYGVTAPVSLGSDPNVLLATVVKNFGDPSDQSDDVSYTSYRILNSDAAVVSGETPITGSVGSTPDGVLISNGVVLLAWNVPGTDQLQYVTVSGSSYDQYELKTITNPKNRIAGTVSVTRDGYGHGILTWSEAEQFEYLSYALVDDTGALVTAPMIFTTGLGDEPKIDTNTYGVGNAYYGGSWQIYLPITVH